MAVRILIGDGLRGRHGWIARWAAAEDYDEETERPAEAADLIVSGY